MDKDNESAAFNIEDDPEFDERFSKNIEKLFCDMDSCTEEIEESRNNREEKSDLDEYVTMEDAGENVEEELSDINESLAKQICDELDQNRQPAVHKKMPRWLKIQVGLIAGVLCVVGLFSILAFTKPGNQLLMKMGVNLGGRIWATWTNNFDDGTDLTEDIDTIDEEDLGSAAPEVDTRTLVWPNHPGDGRQEEGVYNILLLGEEAIGSGTSRGRTDVIVIATMNTNEKKLRLTSLMRDTLVQIPGFQDNKLNSAYEKGGLDLLYKTIALNFDIRLDGCIKVNFENFEKIIDKLGGLDLTLTAGEAKYLNTTNYISNPLNRNVREGTQHLNGNQVLGYSRVRKKATITGNNNDYGRTDRHRIVLNAIFEKYKTKSKVELAAMMPSLLPMITTDIDSKTFEQLLNTFIEMGLQNIDQLRIPADGTFTDNVKVRGMDVIIPDLDENIDVMHKFIFGNTTTGIANEKGEADGMDRAENSMTSDNVSNN